MAKLLDQILVIDVESTCWDGDAWNIAAVLCLLLKSSRELLAHYEKERAR